MSSELSSTDCTLTTVSILHYQHTGRFEEHLVQLADPRQVQRTSVAKAHGIHEKGILIMKQNRINNETKSK